MSSETQAIDLSETGWSDLIDADYAQVRQIAKQYDSVRGDDPQPEIAAGLLRAEDRADEIPDEFRNGHGEGDEDGDDSESDDSKPEPEPAETAQDQADMEWKADASLFTDWFDAINVHVDECRIQARRDELYVSAVDPASVAMVETTLEDSAFSWFDVPEETEIGLSVTRMLGILSGADSDDRVTIEFDAETRNIIVTYAGHEWNMAAIDPESVRESVSLPDLDLPAKGTVEDGVLKTAVGFADNVSDHILLETHGDSLRVYSEGDTDSYEGEDVFEGKVFWRRSGEAQSLFSLDYLKPTMDVFGADQDVEIELGEEFPVKLHSHVDADDETGSLTFMIAPRVRSD